MIQAFADDSVTPNVVACAVAVFQVPNPLADSLHECIHALRTQLLPGCSTSTVIAEHDTAVKTLVGGDADCHFLTAEEFLCSGDPLLFESGSIQSRNPPTWW